MRPGCVVRHLLGVLLLSLCTVALAEPWIDAGDVRIRQDLQLLADYDVIPEPSQTWPRSWPEVARAVESASLSGLPTNVVVALARVRSAAVAASAPQSLDASATMAVAARPRTLRTFEDTPREGAEVGLSVSRFSDDLAVRLSVAGVHEPDDGRRLRLDGSYAAMLLGNWIVSIGSIDRWWGPGHDGSLILSSNARAIPMLSADRNYADAFESPWLSWIGPWRISVGYGVLEGNRDIAHAHIVTFRGTARPLESLEIGLARVAIWCGDNRPCNGQSFKDLLIGNESDVENLDDNPGNQLAELEFRWRAPRSLLPLAVYGSLVGEDSISPSGTPDVKDYLPSRRIHLVGAETWGAIGSGSYRVHFEFADTVCRFSVPDPDYGCAYEHFIYTDGYRYRGRVVGHSIDGDGRSYSLGGTFIDGFGDPWTVLVRSVELNIRNESVGNTVASEPRKLYNFELTHRREVRVGEIELGLGYDHVAEGSDDDRFRAQARFTFHFD